MAKVKLAVTAQVLFAELISRLDGTGIEFIGPNEPAPEQTADDDGAIVHTRWCKAQWPELSTGTKATQSADSCVLTMLVMVGAGDAELDADEFRLIKDLDIVCEALSGLYATDEATGHVVRLNKIDPEQIEAMGQEVRARLGVIPVAGTVTRIVDPS